MRRATSVLFAAFLLVACGERGLDGAWTADVEATATRVPPPLREVWKNVRADLVLEPNGDATLAFGLAGDPPAMPGTWRRDGDAVVFRPNGDARGTASLRLKVEGDRLVADSPQVGAFVLKRK